MNLMPMTQICYQLIYSSKHPKQWPKLYLKIILTFPDVPEPLRLEAMHKCIVLLPDENREALQALLHLLNEISHSITNHVRPRLLIGSFWMDLFWLAAFVRTSLIAVKQGLRFSAEGNRTLRNTIFVLWIRMKRLWHRIDNVSNSSFKSIIFLQIIEFPLFKWWKTKITHFRPKIIGVSMSYYLPSFHRFTRNNHFRGHHILQPFRWAQPTWVSASPPPYSNCPLGWSPGQAPSSATRPSHLACRTRRSYSRTRLLRKPWPRWSSIPSGCFWSVSNFLSCSFIFLFRFCALFSNLLTYDVEGFRHFDRLRIQLCANNAM